VYDLRYVLSICVLLLIIFTVLSPSSMGQNLDDLVEIRQNESQILGRIAVLVVLDAVNHTVLENLIQGGDLGNISRLLKHGTYVIGKTILPSATTASWAALGTGAPPEVNGVVHTYAINSTSYHASPIDYEPSTVGYSEMIKAETLVEVANREGVLTGMVYSESKVIVFCGANGTLTRSQYVPPTYDPYEETLPTSWREYYLRYNLTRSFIDMVDALLPSIRMGANGLFVLDFPEPDASGHTHGPLSDYYSDMLRIIDGTIGSLIDYLNQTDLWERTLFILMSDHSMIQVDPELNVLTSDMEHIQGLPVEHRVVPVGTLVHIYLKHLEDLEDAVDYLSNIDWVDSIWVREPVSGCDKTLDEINLNTTYVGDIVISIKEPYYASKYENRGTHGGINTLEIPIIFSGGMFNVSKEISNYTVSITDIAPTIAGYLGMEKPKDATGVDLGIYNNFADVELGVYPGIAESNSNVTISVNYSLGIYEQDAELKLEVFYENGSFYDTMMNIMNREGTINISIVPDKDGYYHIYAYIMCGERLLGGSTGKLLVVTIKAERPKGPLIGSIAISLALGIVIILIPYIMRRRESD